MTTARTRHLAAAALLLCSATAVGGCSGSSSSSTADGAPARATAAVGAASEATSAAKDGSSAAPATSRALVRKAVLEQTVPDLTKAAATVRQAVDDAKGVLTSEQRTGSPDQLQQDRLVVRVPVARFDDVMARLSAIGTPGTRTISTEDVTGAVADTGSRVRSMQASIDRVRALMGKATTVSEVASIESELARREADLEALQARLADLQGSAAQSTIEITLSQPAAERPQPTADSTNPFMQGLSAGLATLRGIGSVAAGLLGFALPVLLPAAAILVPLVAWWRRRRARRAMEPASPTPTWPAPTGAHPQAPAPPPPPEQPTTPPPGGPGAAS